MSSMTRFFGGSPASVLFRLVILSVIVGFVLKVIGFDPNDIWRSFEQLIEGGWQAIVDIAVWGWRYFLLGAVLVFPIWLVLRVLKLMGGRS